MRPILPDVLIRSLDDTDIAAVVDLDEKISGAYRPEHWERRLGYYLRRDPELPLVAELDGRLVGFMLGEVRAGEFGLDEPAGWIEVVGVDPAHRGLAVGRRLAETLFERFRARGVRRVRTLVHDDVAEIGRFFAGLGFAPEPLRPLYKDL